MDVNKFKCLISIKITRKKKRINYLNLFNREKNIIVIDFSSSSSSSVYLQRSSHLSKTK